VYDERPALGWLSEECYAADLLHRLSNRHYLDCPTAFSSHRFTSETSSIQTVPSILLSNFRDCRRKAWISRRRV